MKDSFVVSISKDKFILNFYYPWFVSNSPFDRDKEAFVLLNSHKRLKETPFEHFHSILAYRNQYKSEYEFIDFEVLGNKYDAWPGQFKNDLENLYLNQSLMFIGGFNKPGSHNEFKFVMYKTIDHVNTTFLFDLEIRSMFGPINSSDFEKYLNEMYAQEKLIFISTFTIYNKFEPSDACEDTSFIMHLIVFQDLKINFEEYNEPFSFTVKSFPPIYTKIDKESALLKIIEQERKKSSLEFLGIVPGYGISDSLIVYAK